MAQTKIKLGFAGTPYLAFQHFQELCSAEHNEVKFILTQPTKRVGRGLSFENNYFQDIPSNIDLFQPSSLDDKEFEGTLKKYEIDLLVVVAYGKIIPEWLLKLPKYGCLNVHFSLLPKWRGASPIQRAIQNGDKETGISFMRLEKEMDTGPVYKQIKIPLRKVDFFEAEQMLVQESLTNLNEVVFDIVQNSLNSLPQDDNAATYANKIDKSEGLVDFKMHGLEIINQFNAFKRWPQSTVQINGELVKLIDIEFIPLMHGEIGFVESFTPVSLNIFCSDGVIKINSLQFPGKKPIAANDLFNSKRDIILAGEKLA